MSTGLPAGPFSVLLTESQTETLLEARTEQQKSYKYISLDFCDKKCKIVSSHHKEDI
jgi:hypothetical protein